MLNLNVLAASTGNEKEVASSTTKITMPKITVVKQGSAATVSLLNLTAGEELAEPADVESPGATIKVNALGNNGAMGKAYIKDTTASADNFAYNPTTGVLTLPTDTDVDKFVIKYNRKTQNAVKVTNSADKFPTTVSLTLKCLAIDPCKPDIVRACYVLIPSFQVSPEVNITLNTEGTLDYTGSMQVNYCGDDKELYTIVMCEDDSE